MNMQQAERSAAAEGMALSSESQVMNIPVALPVEQAVSLEAAARRLGLSTGDLLSHLCRDFLRRLDFLPAS